jgi:O-antigen ligase
LLEICYENGIIGVILVFGGIVWFLIYAVKAAKQTDNKNIGLLIKCMIVIFISWLIHTGLTFPFYSKYSQYSLAFILGPLLVVLTKQNCADSSASTSPDISKTPN